VIAATNGANNLASLFELRAHAFPDAPHDPALDAFTLEGGEAILRRHFADVTVTRARDELRVTDPADIVAYLTSFPPGDGAGNADLRRLARMTDAAFAAGGGVFVVVRDTGYIVGRR
jgi:hypothetical protein